MLNRTNLLTVIVLLFLTSTNIFTASEAASFANKVSKIQKKINNDDVKGAIKLLKRIKISSDFEKERINLLFGDVYLKINQPAKAIEFYEKSFITTNEKIESLNISNSAAVVLHHINNLKRD